jgi:Xaa-Pro dipeptidase
MTTTTAHAPLADLYPDHLRTVMARADAALAAAGRDHLVLPSGRLRESFLDDRTYPFRINPQFKAWLPLTDLTDSWLVYTPGQRPTLVYCQPDDYWHLPPAAPHGYWTGHVDVVVIRQPEQAAAELPSPARSAILGEPAWALGEHRPDNPPAVLDRLHHARAAKTPYELEAMRMANRRAVRGHTAAARAFAEGRSERAIHEAYLHATGHTDLDLPYNNIVGLNEHAAVLHYQHQRHDLPDRHRSLLIDAGADAIGYASDITRTHGNGDERFQALVDGVDAAQRALCDQVRPGVDYRDIHLDAHRRLAGVLHDLGIVAMAPEQQLQTGVSAAFFPHGIGHLLGLQVHDVGGFLAGPDGGRVEPPAGHPHLRLTRTLGPDMVVTIEPGLYFIPMLLERLRAGPHAAAVDWRAVEHLARFGGVRIEDDVRCTDGAPENLTRDAFAEAAAA